VTAARADREEAPGPIAHAAPDVELAEAQLALGRPDLAAEEEREQQFERDSRPDFAAAAEPELAGAPEPELELEEQPQRELAGAVAGRVRQRGATPAPEAADDGAALPAPRPRPGPRLVTFLQGSWRELQRVQWPDRRQVIQATGVVIGFVIVAGIFLGVADTVAAKLMNLIIK
jgi:preprotein translocase SecE subunit